ncbi:MAG: hypothetical protein ACKVQR_03985, partial [Aquabacterium sp.]
FDRRTSRRLRAGVMGPYAALVLLAVLAIVGFIVAHEWRQRGTGLGTSGPTLEEFSRAHPQLDVRPLVENPTGRSPDNLLWILRDRADGRQAMVRQDFVLGRQVSFVPCRDDLPLPPDATGAVCFRTSAAGGVAGARWASFQTDDDGDATAERVSSFYGEQNAMDRQGTLAVHRLRADRWCVGLFGADQ